MRRFFRHDDGATPLLGFMVAILVFTATFSYVVFVAVEDGQDASSNPQAGLDSKAASLASLVIQPGVGWYPIADPCDGTAINGDNVVDGRFGLGREACQETTAKLGDVNVLNYTKILNLRDANFEAHPTNTKADYQEARQSLGLSDAGLDFHIRSEPLLPSIRELLANGFKDPNLRPLYIGDYVQEGGGGDEITRLVQHTAGAVDNGDDVTLYVDITNNGTAPTTTVFEVQFSIPLSSGTVNALYHTPVLAGSETHNATVTVRKTADWSWANASDPTVDYIISDLDGGVGGGEISLAGITMTHADTRILYHVHTDKLEYLLPGGGDIEAKVYFDAYEGDGSGASGQSWSLAVYNTTGVQVDAEPNPNSNRGWEKFTLDKVDTYRVELTDSGGSTLWNEDLVNVVSASVGTFNAGGGGTWVPAASVAPEMGYVNATIEQFEANVYSADYDHADVPHGGLPAPPAAGAGDVYPDVKKVMNNDVPAVLMDSNDKATLDNYNVLIVGSNVDHQVMTSAAAKQTIRDWVYAGGLLIVLGSTEQAVQWLQPIFHSALDSAGGGISIPDENHPVLNVPNDLDYSAYNTHGIVWSYTRSQDADHFTHIVTDGDEDYLALSDPGQFGEGRVLLASYQPYDLTDSQADDCSGSGSDLINCEPMRMLHNFVTISYQGLYIDYGPPLPVDRPHGSAVRIASVDHPEIGERVAVRLFIFVF